MSMLLSPESFCEVGNKYCNVLTRLLGFSPLIPCALRSCARKERENFITQRNTISDKFNYEQRNAFSHVIFKWSPYRKRIKFYTRYQFFLWIKIYTVWFHLKSKQSYIGIIRVSEFSSLFISKLVSDCQTTVGKTKPKEQFNIYWD